MSEAKGSLGKLADDALKGRPTVITRGGKLVILRAYDPPEPSSFDTLIDDAVASDHVELTDSLWKQVRTHGRASARDLPAK